MSTAIDPLPGSKPSPRGRSLHARIAGARVALSALRRDVERAEQAARERGARSPSLAALGDTSVWALALLRGAAAMRASLGSSMGLSTVLRVAFHIDVWSDAIGGGLRLPHPFNIVIGDGAEIGPDCMLMHNVTVQRGAGTRVGAGAVLGTGVTVLKASVIGDGALIGANSVVRGTIPAGAVAVGAPARAVRSRDLATEEVQP